MYAGVIVDIRNSAVDRVFHYRVPSTMRVQVGHRVSVSFGTRTVEGYVLELTEEVDLDEHRVKNLCGLLDTEPIVTQEQIDTARFMSRRYLGCLAQSLQLFLPPGGRYGRRRVTRKMQVGYQLAPGVDLDEAIRSLPATAYRQKAVLHQMKDAQTYLATQLVQATDASHQTLKRLAAKGWLLRKDVQIQRQPLSEREAMGVPSLTVAQQTAVSQIRQEMAGARRPVLLHGVTGSGKTEVYLRLIADVVARGKQAIVLVPEIALTPQMVARFRDRFGCGIELLHSALTLGERYDGWWRIFHGEARVIIGARSSLFAPVKNLGLIVLDEEHEATYKQEEGQMKYHAREVAIYRASTCQAQVILGSATPSLESFHNGQTGRYLTVSMPQRVCDRPFPETVVVDMRDEFARGNRGMFSTILSRELDIVLARDEQAIIFLNRRGFASFLLCRECGYVIECRNCHVSLTYHQSDDRLHCHYCAAKSPTPSLCPQCGSRYLRQFGTGTQKVEEGIKANFPNARPIRMDADTTSRKDAHRSLLAAFRKREANVLIGTQMIAKGLDFPYCTLVGILSADMSLNLPDFRAGERTFQVLTQVSGRAGRSHRPGRVIIQCYEPQHYAVQAAAAHDYEGFFRHEIKFRRDLRYPPFSTFIRVLVRGPAHEAEAFSQELGKYFHGKLTGVQILGPMPAPITKIKGQNRWHILIKTTTDLGDALRDLPKPPPKTTVGVDPDPQFFL